MATRNTPRAEKAATKPYTVLSPLDHDGEPYKRDDQVELTEDQARPLLDLKVVQPAPAGT